MQGGVVDLTSSEFSIYFYYVDNVSFKHIIIGKVNRYKYITSNCQIPLIMKQNDVMF